MPRDSDTAKAPLKRGDACLYCRKRRIKCSAEKPSCSQCNGRRECVYDNGKPVSRVRQLEDKVAQLESMLIQTTSRRPSESEQSNEGPSQLDSGGNPRTNSSGNTRSTSASDVNMQQDPGPSNSAFSYDRVGNGNGDGTDDMMYDLDAIQRQFNDATSGMNTDFFGFGASMFGQTTQPTQLPTLSNPNQDATAMFDFSTLDPNFMSLVNSFDETLNQPAPQTQAIPRMFQTNQQAGPSIAQPQAFQQPISFATTVTDNNDTSTGFTPYLNADYTPSPSDPVNEPSTSTGYPLSRDSFSAPTPSRHFEHLSQTVAHNARAAHEAPAPVIGEPTWNTGPNTGTIFASDQSPPNTLPGSGADVVDRVVAENVGDKSPEGPSSYANQTATSFSQCFQKPADTRAGLGADLDQEGYELVGGWFDANDLPRVARDHLQVPHCFIALRTITDMQT